MNNFCSYFVDKVIVSWAVGSRLATYLNFVHYLNFLKKQIYSCCRGSSSCCPGGRRWSGGGWCWCWCACFCCRGRLTGTAAVGAIVIGLLFLTSNKAFLVVVASVCQGYMKFVTFRGRVFPWTQLFLPQHLMIFTLLAATIFGLFDLATSLASILIFLYKK